MSKTLSIFLALILLAPALAVRADEEARSYYVEEIRFEGNASLPDGELRDLMRTRARAWLQLTHPSYNPEWLRGDLARLSAHYHRAGFYEVRLWSHPEDDVAVRPVGERLAAVELTIHIEENKRRYVRRSVIQPPTGGGAARLGLQLLPGEPFDPQVVDTDGRRILRHLQSRGHFAAEVVPARAVHPTPSYAKTDSVDVFFHIQPGPMAILREIRFEGSSLPEDVLLKELRVTKDQTLTLEDLIASEQNLLDTGLFRTAIYHLESLGPEGNQREGIRLTWRLRERDSGLVEFGGGYGSADGYRLLGAWTHRNFGYPGGRLGFETLHLFKRDSHGDFGRSYERQTIEYRVRNIFKAGTHLGINIYREKDYEQPSGLYSLETLAFRLELLRRLNPDLILRLREEQELGTQRTLVEEAEEPEPRYMTRSLSFLLDHDTRDHFFHPRRGDQIHFSYKVAGGVQGGDHHLQRLKLSGRWYQRRRSGILAQRFSLSWVGAFGRSLSQDLDGVPADGVPYEQRFYCGGATTVRGYETASLGPRREAEEPPGEGNAEGGRFMLVGNLEWRRPLSGFLPLQSFDGLGVSFFLDAGNTWMGPEDISIHRLFPWQGDEGGDLRLFWGTGIGIHYLTPVTVLRLDYGLPLQPREGEGSGRWHLSLGHSF